jgi:hypothetical protein
LIFSIFSLKLEITKGFFMNSLTGSKLKKETAIQYRLKRPRAAVRVMIDQIDKEMVLRISNDGCFIASGDLLFHELDRRIRVVDADSQTQKPTGKFLISAETFDPFHFLVDLF